MRRRKVRPTGLLGFVDPDILTYHDAVCLMHDLEAGELEGYDPYHQFKDANGRWVYVLFQSKGDR